MPGPAGRGAWDSRARLTRSSRPRTATDRRFASVLASARSDLTAIRSLDSLVASYARESFHRGGGASEPSEAPYRQAVLAAYALRWLELSVEADRPTDGGEAANMDRPTDGGEAAHVDGLTHGGEAAHVAPTAQEDADLAICSAGC